MPEGMTTEEFQRLQRLDDELYHAELDEADARLDSAEEARETAVRAWQLRLAELAAQLRESPADPVRLRLAYDQATRDLYLPAARADSEFQRLRAGHYCERDDPEPALEPYPGRFSQFVRHTLA